MEFIKNIGIEKGQPAGLGSMTIPDIDIDSIICKSIIQYDKKTLLMFCIKEIILMDIMNLETDIEKEIIKNGNNLLHIESSNYYVKNNGYYLCYSQDIKNIPNIFEDNLIKNIYQLQNGNYIISQEKNFSVASFEYDSFSLKYSNDHSKGSITNISEINETIVIINQGSELYRLEFSKIEYNDYGIKKIK